MLNKEQLETIKKGYQWWLEAENQADKNEFAECITTEDVPALIAQVERLQKFEQKAIYVIEENKRLREALEFYADEENYRNISMAKLYSNIAADNGKNALQALGDGDE